MTDQELVLGIDFGTSYTVAATRLGSRSPEVIEVGGLRRVPSIVLVDDDEIVVGERAEQLSSNTSGRVLRSPKSRIGEPTPVILNGRPHDIVDLVAGILRHVWDEAVRHHGRPPNDLRLTHPATWSSTRRQQLVDASERAGLIEPTLIPEPVAAALAYGEDIDLGLGSNVLVYDLGGGTFDTAVLRSTDAGFVVVGRPGGDDRIGGELFDQLVARAIGHRLAADTFVRLQLAEDDAWRHAATELRREARRAKEALSSGAYAEVALALPTGLVRLRFERDELDQLIAPHIDDSITVMRQTLAAAGLDASDLASVYLVGGASRSPMVEAMVGEAFPGIEVSRRGDPKSVVAVGATHPDATPTSVAQRPSTEEESAGDRLPPPPGATIGDATGPGSSTRIDSVTSDRAAESSTSTKQWMAAVAAGAVVLGGVGLATRGGSSIGDASSTTDSVVAVTTTAGGNSNATVAVLPTTLPVTVASTVATTLPPDTTLPPASTAPPTTAPETTVPPVTAAPTALPTADEVRRALIDSTQLSDSFDPLDEVVEGTPFCPRDGRDEPEFVESVGYQRFLDGLIIEQIFQNIDVFADAALADAAFTAEVEQLSTCEAPTYDFGEFTYDLEIIVQPLPETMTTGLPCFDDGAIVVTALTNGPDFGPDIVQSSQALRCGSNVSVTTQVVNANAEFLTDTTNLEQFSQATTFAAIALADLKGSN